MFRFSNSLAVEPRPGRLPAGPPRPAPPTRRDTVTVTRTAGLDSVEPRAPPAAGSPGPGPAGAADGDLYLQYDHRISYLISSRALGTGYDIIMYDHFVPVGRAARRLEAGASSRVRVRAGPGCSFVRSFVLILTRNNGTELSATAKRGHTARRESA